ncbi:MAG TPA: large conductance mechanosensitive channel protein MscL [Ilumatobacteraceae bacterium]|nr:large conductance mechanosensitive channel protein MscL [Ilumatobacteraceae bacterium]
MKSWIQEFKEFVNRGNLVELAIAFVLAAAFGLVIKAIVEGVIMPIIAAIFGQPNFDGITITIGDSVILIGVAITAIVNFLIVALVCFLIIKAYNKMKGPVEEDGPSEVDLLIQIRDELRSRAS